MIKSFKEEVIELCDLLPQMQVFSRYLQAQVLKEKISNSPFS